MKVTKLPFDPGPAAWNCLVADKPEYPQLEMEIHADVAIVGAGFAGISAARRLKQIDPTLSIILLEARDIAEGPAGRNSGFMIDLPHHLASSDYSGETTSDIEQIQMNRSAIRFAANAAEELGMGHEIFSPSGKINAAATSKGDRHNRDYAKHLDSLGETYELLDAREMQAMCGSSYYQSGLFTPGTVLIQPAGYVHRLVQGMSENGVLVFERSPVISNTRQDSAWKLQTPHGSVSASKVILTTNGHVESFGHFKRQLMHIYLYASLTRPLSNEELQKLGGKESWGFTPADPLGSTVRRIRYNGETRIVMRNGIEWAPGKSTSQNQQLAFAGRHDDSFEKRFPSLGKIEMEYRWGGLLCLGRNGGTAFGEIENNLFSACCQNGLGTVSGTLSGMAIADVVLKQSTEESRFLLNTPVPSTLPPEPFATIGANAVFKWGEFRAGKEI